MTHPSGSRTDADALVLSARVDAPADRYAFETTPGVHSPDAFRPAALLLLEVLWDESPAALGSVQANWGIPGIVLADVAEHVHCVDAHARAADCCRRNARRNDVANSITVICAPSPAAVEGFDDLDAVAYAPRPYAPLAQGRRRIVDALQALAPDGTLYLAATPESGLERYRETLATLDADSRTVRDHGDCEVVAADRPSALESNAMESSEFVTARTHHERVAGVDLAVVTEPGVFAAGDLDDGTRLLLEHATVDDGDRVLDCCCGSGAIGAWAAATADCEVLLTDADAVATDCARRTLDATGVTSDGGADSHADTHADNDADASRPTVHTADCLDAVAGERFDRVLSNPPTHAGDAVLAELFAGWTDVLAPGGELRVVHHRALDLDHHFDQFESVRTVATGEEHVVRAARN